MQRGPKQLFTFRITYFKPNGHYYHETEVEWEIHSTGDKHTIPMMHDAANKLRGLRGNGPDSMPGLGVDASDWYGYILIDCNRGFPVLILPEEKEK